VSGTGTLEVNDDSTVGDESALAVSKGGVIKVDSSHTIVFGTAGFTIGAGALTGGNTQAVIKAAANTNTGDVTVSGNLVATEGAAILSTGTGKKITIESGGSISTRNAGNAYEYVELTGSAVIDGDVNFDATMGAPKVTLSGTLKGNAGATITTKITGQLVIGSVITLQAPIAQSLNGAILDGGAAPSVTGSLELTGSATDTSLFTTLTIGATSLNIGSAAAAGTLAVNGGKIILEGTTSKIVLLKDTTPQLGTFILGAVTSTPGGGIFLKGLAAATGSPANGALAAYGTKGSGTYGTGNITIANTGDGGGGTATNTATVDVDTSGGATQGQVTITGGSSSGNTLTKESGIYRI
jgi:hypothetical protein